MHSVHLCRRANRLRLLFHVVFVGFIGFMLLLAGTAVFFLVHNDTAARPADASESWARIAQLSDEFAAGVQSQPIRENMRIFSSVSHLAGSTEDHQQAERVRTLLQEYGVPEVSVEEFEVLLSYPRSASLRMVSPARFEATLAEPPVPADPTSSALSTQVPTFNGYSASGALRDVEVVYVNYGRFEDYELLREHGIDLTGRVVLVRYGKGFRGNKAMLGEQRGAVGVLIYSDPADDGYAAGPTYPQGGWRPEYGVQRGTVWTGNGDPLTPGWASVKGAPRLSIEEARDATRMRGQPLPSIPIHPISWHDAAPLLSNLTGALPAEDW
jgi:N-acetylated-alpha-linked acidic dipeptidase